MTELHGWTTTLAVTAVVLAGLLSGLRLGTGLAHQSAQALPETSWTLMHQAEDRLFRVIVPPAFLLTLVMLATSAFLIRGTARVCFALAALLTAVEVVATLVLNVPINHAVQTWVAGSAPADWMHLRDAWLRRHWSRSLLGLLGFVLAVVGTALRR